MIGKRRNLSLIHVCFALLPFELFMWTGQAGRVEVDAYFAISLSGQRRSQKATAHSNRDAFEAFFCPSALYSAAKSHSLFPLRFSESTKAGATTLFIEHEEEERGEEKRHSFHRTEMKPRKGSVTESKGLSVARGINQDER